MNEEIKIVHILGGKEIGRATLHLHDHEIVDVVVDPDWRQKGIATALIRALEEAAKSLGIPRVWATVRVDNTASIHLWKKLQFEGGLLKFEKWIKKDGKE